jgi:hypothetical protein
MFNRRIDAGFLAEAEANEDGLGATIIYVNKQKAAIDLANDLVGQGYAAKAYHGGMDSTDREAVEAWFLGRSRDQASSSSSPIVVGTTAFGMGVDRSDIRHVIHYDISRSVEDYIQGCGRAGRDGQSSSCVAFFNPSEVPSLRSQIYGSTPTHKQLTSLVEYILSEEANICKEDHGVLYLPIFKLSSDLDVQELSLRLALSHLVQKEILREITSLYRIFKSGQVDLAAYSSYRSSLITSSSSAAATAAVAEVEVKPSKFAAIMDEIVDKINKAFNAYSARKKWIELDVFELSNQQLCHPSLVISAINQLVQHRVINLHPSKPTESIYARYEFIQPADQQHEQQQIPSYTVKELAEMIYRHALENQHRTLLRNDEIVSLLESVASATLSEQSSRSSIDIWDRIAEYFDEVVDTSNSLLAATAAASAHTASGEMEFFSAEKSTSVHEIDESSWKQMASLVANNSLPSDDPLLLARFAAGVISPRIFRLKLQRNVAFGCCMANDWLDIVQKCSELIH